MIIHIVNDKQETLCGRKSQGITYTIAAFKQTDEKTERNWFCHECRKKAEKVKP